MAITDNDTIDQMQRAALPSYIKDINKQLVTDYGKDILGRANFRLVYSENIVEKRMGRFEEHCGSIYVRDFFGTKELPKYSYLRDTFVLEQLTYNYNPELPDSQRGHYEPIWSDWGIEGIPNYRAVRTVVRSKLFGIPKTKLDYIEEEEAIEKASYDRIRGEIEDASTLGSGEQIGYSGKER